MSNSPAVGWVPTSTNFEVASARLRCLLPSRYLQERGWRSELVDRRDPYRHDVVVFQKAYGEAEVELAQALRARGKRTVFDLCDNHFYNPEDVPTLRERADRLRRMVDSVDIVSVSTESLAELVPETETVLVDDVLDEFEPKQSAWRRLAGSLSRRRFRLVWYGGAGLHYPSFGLVHLRKVLPLLEDLHREAPLVLTVISNSESAFEAVVGGCALPVRYVPWRYETFATEFAGHDVCIVPVERNPFTICKTANRVALSLKLATPVVADTIPSFEAFRPYAVLDNWSSGLRSYRAHAELRARDAAAGREYVERTWTKERAVRQWSDAFTRALDAH